MMMLYDTVISWLSKNYHQAHFFCWTWSITVFCWLSNVTLWWGHKWSYQRKLHLCPCLTSGGRRLKKHYQLYVSNMSSNCFLMIKMEKMRNIFWPKFGGKKWSEECWSSILVYESSLCHFSRIRICLSESWTELRLEDSVTLEMTNVRRYNGRYKMTSWLDLEKLQGVLGGRDPSWQTPHTTHIWTGGRGVGKWEKCHSFESNWKKWASKKGNVP